MTNDAEVLCCTLDELNHNVSVYLHANHAWFNKFLLIFVFAVFFRSFSSWNACTQVQVGALAAPAFKLDKAYTYI